MPLCSTVRCVVIAQRSSLLATDLSEPLWLCMPLQPDCLGKGLSELAWMLRRTGTIMDAEEDKSRGHTNACFTLFERLERKR